MQIHELTKRKRTDEGILDGLKAAVNVAKTGADSFASHMIPGYDTAKAGVQAAKTGYKQGRMKGLGKALTSTSALAQAQNQQLQKKSQQGLQDLKAQGINAKTPLSFYVDQVKKNTDATAEREKIKAQVTDIFDLAPIVADGSRLVLPGSSTGYPSNYYLSSQGVWTNELNQPVTDPKTIDKFNDLANSGKAKEEPIPGAQKGKGGAAAVNKAANAAAATAPAAQPAQQPMSEAAPRVQPGNLAARAKQRNVSAAQSELAKAAAPGSQANQQLAQDPSNAAYKGEPVAAKTPTKRKSSKANLQAGFEQWIANQLPGFNTIGSDSKAQLKKQFGIILKTKKPEAFDQYILLAQAAILKAKEEQNMPDTEPTSDVEDQLSQLRGKAGKRTGNPEIDKLLTDVGIQLSESQVYITKDIVVKTSKGNYTKRHNDQQWYDPNGVLIDPDKYAEYIAKLDATPAAQTRYQADSEKAVGSDTGVAKGREYKANKQDPAPKIELPKATAADWEEYKAEQNRLNNQAIDKTVNDLRNAEYFRTGQEHYLQQQLAQLMAKKF